MSQKINRPKPDIGVRAVHPKYGNVELLDKIMSITNSYWIIADSDGELHIADEADMSDYYNY